MAKQKPGITANMNMSKSERRELAARMAETTVNSMDLNDLMRYCQEQLEEFYLSYETDTDLLNEADDVLGEGWEK
jgi:hypothetical protein